MSEDPIRDAARTTRRRHKVPPGAACLLCAEKDPDCLIAVARTILEAHHIFGVGTLPDTVWLCPTCHRKLHVWLLDAGLDFSHPAERILLEVIRIVLVASAVVFRTLADTYQWLAERLAAFIASLDNHCPTWRAIPEAQL
jgi:hypothetical protein